MFSEEYDDKIDDLLEELEADDERREHMELLADAFFENLQRDDCEYGGIGLDSKRPFGNSNVEPDIAEMIGLDRDVVYGEVEEENEEMIEYLRSLYDDLGIFLIYKWREFRKVK